MNKPTIIDFLNTRSERQKINNLLAYNSIVKSVLTKKTINVEELNRVLNELQISKTELLNKCINDEITGKILAGRIAKKSSRQGTKDEELQILVCYITAIKYNIQIEKLSAQEFRPTKNGEILSDKELKIKKISKNDCLKSFDAKISGNINGWLFAKVVFGSGGHQDNVFEEAHILCEWIIKYSKKDEYFIILIDTDKKSKVDELKIKYDSIIIGNHIEIQQYFINMFTIT